MASTEPKIVDPKEKPAEQTQIPAEPKQKPAEPKRKHLLRTWILRYIFALLLLVILAAIVVQIVLWTSLPKSIVVGQVEKGLGLRIGVNSLGTGWLGHTTLNDVELALPLSDQSFLRVPQMRVRHTNLVGLLLGWPIQIKSIELDKPVLYVRQNGLGQWNLQEVAQLLGRAAGKKTGDQTAQTLSTPALPKVQITNMTIVVVDDHARQARIEPINVNGSAETPVSWKYDIEIPSPQKNVPPHFSFLGRVAPGGAWAHEATLWVHDVAPWVRPWKPGFNEPIDFDGHWSGELSQTGVSGTLQIKNASYGVYRATGLLSASHANGTTSLSPQKLLIHTPVAALKDLEVPNGTVSYDGKFLRLAQVQLSLLGGPANFNGWYQPALRQGSLDAWWQNLTAPVADIKQSGKLHLDYSWPLAAPMSIAGNLDARGTSSQGPFEAVTTFGASGPDIRQLSWYFDAPALAWYRGQQIVLNGLAARGLFTDDGLHKIARLTNITLASGTVSGSGFYDLATDHSFELHLAGRDWPLHLVEGTRLAFGLDANGKSLPSSKNPQEQKRYITLQNFFLGSGDTTLSFSGVYDGREPKPVKADVTFINRPGAVTDLSRTSLVTGSITGRAHLDGVLDLFDQTQIAVTGSLDSEDATVLGHIVGEVHAKVVGAIDNEQASLHADGIPFLGGTWDLGGQYIMQQDNKPVYATDLSLNVKDLPLPHLTQFLKMMTVQGVFDGAWKISFPGLRPVPERIVVTGGGTVKNFAASDLIADDVTFKTWLNDGKFKVDPIVIRRGNYGRIDAHADLALSQWRQVHAGINFAAFPINLPAADVGVQLWGGTDRVEFFLPESAAQAPEGRQLRVEADLNLRTVIAVHQQPEGEVRLAVAMRGRTLDLRELHGDLLGGTLTADAVSDLDHLYSQTRANVSWNRLQSDRFVRLFPQLKGFGGTFAGTARLQPDPNPRALEPLKLDVMSHATAAHWRTIQIGDAQIHAFLGRHRLIAADMTPSLLRLAGGNIDFWFSSSGHVDTVLDAAGVEQTTGTTISNQLNLTLRSLQIDQVVKAYDPTHPPGFGLINGSLFMLSAPKTTILADAASSAALAPAESGTTRPTTGSTRPAVNTILAQQQNLLQRLLRTTTLDGNLNLEASDLGGYGPIAALYNAMHIGQDVRKPTGRGNVSLHMENGRLHLSNLYYFNRGIEVRGVATADQVWLLPDNPIHGSVAGTARPLKSIRFPLFAEADAILTGLQKTLTSIEFGGTVHNPGNYRLVSLSQLGGELRGIILGEIGQSR